MKQAMLTATWSASQLGNLTRDLVAGLFTHLVVSVRWREDDGGDADQLEYGSGVQAVAKHLIKQRGLLDELVHHDQTGSGKEGQLR